MNSGQTRFILNPITPCKKVVEILNIPAIVVNFLGNIWTIITVIFDFLDNISPILTAILGFFSVSLWKRIKRWRLKRVLSFRRNSKACFISVPRFKNIILNKERDVAIYDEVALLMRVNSILAGVGISIITGEDENDVVYDEIQIGGPVSNKFTNRYFKRYLKGITWVVTEDHFGRYQADKNLKTFDYSFIKTTRGKKEGFKIGTQFYSYIPSKKGLAILIKIIDKSGASPRAIHLLFGAGTNGTMGAVTYFVNHYTDIYKKNKSRPYIGVFEVDGSGARVGEVEWYECSDYFR